MSDKLAVISDRGPKVMLAVNDSRGNEEHNDNPEDALLILGSKASSFRKRTKCTVIWNPTPHVHEQLVKMLHKLNRQLRDRIKCMTSVMSERRRDVVHRTLLP